MKLVLGTAQFGSNYGITNKNGKLSAVEARQLLGFCEQNKIQLIDTAPVYGRSETILGQYNGKYFKFITKIPTLDNKNSATSEFIFSSINRSLTDLRVSKLYAVLIHNPKDLIKNQSDEIYQTLKKLKQKGLVEKIGVSVYNIAELAVIHKKYELDIVQLPFSIFDQSFFRTGWLEILSKSSVEIHIRSIFLQGLLLDNIKNFGPKFSKWDAAFSRYEDWLKMNKISPLEACVRTVLSIQEIDFIVIGVENVTQLAQIFYFSYQSPINMPEPFFDYDEKILNPSKW